MACRYEFRGSDGMLKKIRRLAINCSGATEGMSRTLLLAVSAPDPVTTPDCENASPRGIRIQTLDDHMTPSDIALLLGAMMGFIEQVEHWYAVECGEEFHELVDEARDTFGHSVTMKVVPVTSAKAKSWEGAKASRAT